MEVITLGQFLYKTVHDYVGNGFYFYVLIELPEGRDLAKIDRKITEQYNANEPRWKRFQRRQNGDVVVRYIRLDKMGLLIATDGNRRKSEYFRRENWKDIRVNPIEIWKYSIGVYKGKGELRLRAYAIKSAEKVLHKIALEPQNIAQTYLNGLSPFTYRGIISQKKKLIRSVNNRRKKAGLEPITVWQPPYKKKDTQYGKKKTKTVSNL